VKQAESAGDTVILVDIDPREGSGVIPLDWLALLQPRFADGRTGTAIRGVSSPDLGTVQAPSGVLQRNDDDDRFRVVFPLTYEDGQPVLPPDATLANWSCACTTTRAA
jgi:hypothetical protein